MSEPIRVMVERGKKKRSVASAFDWPGWDGARRPRSGRGRPRRLPTDRYAKVAAVAGLADEFRTTGDLGVVERLEGIGMTDFYGVSMRSAAPEYDQMTDAECDRKLALLAPPGPTSTTMRRGSRPSSDLGPRGGGRDRERIIRHVNGAEIDEFAKKVGVYTPLDARDSPARLAAHRDALVEAIRDHNARGVSARNWTVQFVIRHSAYHMLDHAWEMEDRDLSDGSATLP